MWFIPLFSWPGPKKKTSPSLGWSGHVPALFSAHIKRACVSFVFRGKVRIHAECRATLVQNRSNFVFLLLNPKFFRLILSLSHSHSQPIVFCADFRPAWPRIRPFRSVRPNLTDYRPIDPPHRRILFLLLSLSPSSSQIIVLWAENSPNLAEHSPSPFGESDFRPLDPRSYSRSPV